MAATLLQILHPNQSGQSIELLQTAGITQVDDRQQIATANQRVSLRQQEQVDAIDRTLV